MNNKHGGKAKRRGAGAHIHSHPPGDIVNKYFSFNDRLLPFEIMVDVLEWCGVAVASTYGVASASRAATITDVNQPHTHTRKVHN